MRKVIQIVVTPLSDLHFVTIYALANDGTMWSLVVGDPNGDGEWEQTKPIPSDRDSRLEPVSEESRRIVSGL